MYSVFYRISVFLHGSRFHYFKKSLNFIFSCSHPWPIASSKFLLAWPQVLQTQYDQSSKSWSFWLCHPICLPLTHILVLQSSHSLTRVLNFQWFPESALFPIPTNLIQNHCNPSVDDYHNLLASFASSSLTSTLILSLARVLLLKCVSDLFSILI